MAETPNAPSGLHHAPGNTVSEETLGTDDDVGTLDEPELAGVEVPEDAGSPETAVHAAIFMP